jgi:ComF family protein
MTLSLWWKGFIHLIYPHLCAGCQKENIPFGELFCVRCEHALPVTDFHIKNENEGMDRLEGRLPLDGVTAMFRFYPGGLVQKIIHSIKYQNQPNVAYDLGLRYGTLLMESPHYRQLDYIIPVPLHLRKLRKRGYNQSAFFANGLAFSLTVPVLNHILLRSKNTETQTQKSKLERLQNLENAFKTKDGQIITNKNILIVDDVLTTGATLESCGLTLLPFKPKGLFMATIAIAE